jgi:eukaryotic-like serine/threonine-protein kinase
VHQSSLGLSGEVVVLDWGLALAPALPGAAGTVSRPEWGPVVGTPAYMAPEQAEGRTDAVGPRTDVYGLGAILYEILTGRPPFVGQDAGEVLRRASQDPLLPPRQLCCWVPPPLEAVCLRALARRPEERYPSASDLAADIQRFLADEPVRAWREPLRSRGGRWLRRRRALATGVAVLGLTLLITSLTSAGLLYQEKSRTEQKRQEAEAAREASDGNARRAEAEQAEAERQRDEARRARAQAEANLASSYIASGTWNRAAGQSAQAEEFLLKAKKIYAGLVAAWPAATEYQEGDAVAQGNLANLYRDTNRLKEAETAYREVLAKLEGLVRTEPTSVDHRRNLARVWSNLGILYADGHRPKDAHGAFDRAVGLLRELVRKDPSNAVPARGLVNALIGRGMALAKLQETAQAQKDFLEALPLARRLVRTVPTSFEYQSHLANVHNNLGTVYLATARLPEAEAAYREAVAVWDGPGANNPHLVGVAVGRGCSSRNLGLCLFQQHKPEAALDWLGQGIRALEGVLQRDRNNTAARQGLCDACADRGIVLGSLGRWAEAAKDWEQAGTLCDGARRLALGAHRATALARAGEHGRAAAQADALLGRSDLSDAVRFRVACAYALASAAADRDVRLAEAERRELVERHATRAVELLGQIQGRGHFLLPANRRLLQEETSLDPLRARPDFRRLLQQGQEEPEPK